MKATPFNWPTGAFMAAALVGLGGCSAAQPPSAGTIKIGVDLPESGNELLNGVPTLNGIKFAVQKQGAIKGFTLSVENRDDAVNGAHDPNKGAQNIRDLLADPDVLGVVGPFDSTVAKAEIPVANSGNLTLISPANTNECLTQDHPAPECEFTPASLRPNGKNNYFRVVTTDNLQGPAMAIFFYDTLKLTSVAVGWLNDPYDKGVADKFQREFEAKGGRTTAHQEFDPSSTTDFKPFYAQARASGAQGVYIAGNGRSQVCGSRQQMKTAFPNVPFGGSDGLVTGQCIKDAGDNADNMYGTVTWVDATHIPSAKSTIDEFGRSFSGANDFGAYTMAGYDCTNIMISAIGRAIDDAGGKKPTRDQVRQEVAKTSHFPGILGDTSFDANGDTSNRILTVFKVGPGPGITGLTPKDWIFGYLVDASSVRGS